jgi:hypothetical protein
MSTLFGRSGKNPEDFFYRFAPGVPADFPPRLHRRIIFWTAAPEKFFYEAAPEKFFYAAAPDFPRVAAPAAFSVPFAARARCLA